MCTHAQPEQLSWHEAGGFHSLARARDDWSHRHGGARGGWSSDRFRSITMSLATATHAPRALDVNQEWRDWSFSGNRVDC
jgi:hypothetical protein